ncbi:PaaI family thioesterase [Mangrovibacterium lignilyticum]|uniref:PaaI family thioesterase n=1 Tax=Mangrovibacterium lignilyticum TaxID=2668052 RepID=UPI0013D03EA4|nr:PaaI family thioesterase [Mangrovibacterium lignilyticum]
MKDSLISNLGIKIESIDDGEVTASMPVSEKTMRPGGILHGGASLALAETIAGLGSILIIDATEYDARGIQVTANHVGGMTEGTVLATAKIVHQGKQTHIWNVDITNKEGKLISTARVTNMIIKKND